MGGGKNDEPESSQVAGSIAKRMFIDTQPMREKILQQGDQFLEGGYDYTQTPMWDYGRRGIEGQYDVARDNIIANMPSGGQMLDTLADTEVSRANALAGLGSQIAQDEYNKIYGLATGTPQQSMTTLAQVGGQQAAMQANAQNNKYGAAGQIGEGVGAMFGLK